jgi:transcriptional regulator with XRE-family HTH domain
MKNTSYIPDDLDERLRAYRKTRRWTLVRMAKKLGVSIGSLHSYETGKRKPSFLSAARMEQAMPNLFQDVA